MKNTTIEPKVDVVENTVIKGMIWDRVGLACAYILFGLIPIWFLPFTAQPIEDAKELFVGLAILCMAGAWLAKVLAVGRIDVPKTSLWFAALGFFAFVGISTIFSTSSVVSIWGNNSQPDTLLGTLLILGALFFVPIWVRDLANIITLLFAFSGSAVVVAVYSLLQFFGIYIIPLDFARSNAFNLIGSIPNLGVFLGLGLVVVSGILASLRLSLNLRILFGCFALVLMATLLLINTPFVWLGLMVAFAIVASWQIMQSLKQPVSAQQKEHALPSYSVFLVLMIISAVLFFVRPPMANLIQPLPARVSPSLNSSIQIAKESFASSWKKAILGSGPATFTYQYLAYRPLTINQTAFFGLRFMQGFSYITTILVSLGVVGTVLFIGTLAYILAVSMRGITTLNKEASPFEKSAIVAFAGFVFLTFSLFFYTADLTTLLFTFLFAGLVIASLRAGNAITEYSFYFARLPQRIFGVSLVTIVLLTFIIMTAYWHVQKYVAAAIHTSGVKIYNSNQDLNKATSRVQLAVNLDSSNDNFLRTLAQLYALQAIDVLKKNSGGDSNNLQKSFEQKFTPATQFAQLAIQANPIDSLNLQQLGAIYDSVLFAVGGAESLAIDNYIKAEQLDPKNPAADLLVAQTYVNSADKIEMVIKRLSAQQGSQDDVAKARQQKSDYLNNAIDYVNKAIEKKSDYAPAHFLAAQIYDRQGNRSLAIEKTIKAQEINPQDIGVIYQLGVLYYFDDQIAKAQQQFKKAITLSPNYSNARYFLGVIYDKQDMGQKALEQFQKVAELNPDNSEVKKIVDNLQQGRGALDGITPPLDQRIEEPVSQEDSKSPSGL
ncbi:MAG: tetratricopeptide repeat protein [Candidatus Spechtbacteria bacterium]|nr:tetratricopeptide repeat protein [Candidatus Spechtbacteria bacterium]